MKIKEITVSHTRQVTSFHPYNISMTATIKEDEDVSLAENTVHELILRILYKDRPIERDSLIKQLCHSTPPPIVNKPSETKHDAFEEDANFV